MKKKMNVLLIGIIFCVVFISSCSKSTNAPSGNKTTTGLDANGKPPIESTIDPSQIKPPTPVTGEEADKDLASIVIRAYYAAIQSKDYEKAYSLLTGEFKKKKGTFTEFIKPLTQAAEEGRTYGNVSIQGVNTSQAGTEKIVTFSLVIFEKQNPITLNGIYFLFQQPDSSWMIADTLSDK
jgi:hypothetical protein